VVVAARGEIGALSVNCFAQTPSAAAEKAEGFLLIDF
jgi:hypothetical protein